MPARSLEADPKVARAQALSFRCPLLPFDDLLRWADPGWQISPDDARFEAAFEETRELLRRRLRQELPRPELREGLLLISGDFFQAQEDLARDSEASRAEVTEAALAEQWVRLATMVDFGTLQLAPTIGEIARSARLRPGAISSRHSRIDIGYLRTVAQAAAALPSVRRELRFFPNSSLDRINAEVRYLRAESNRGQYSSAATGVTEALHAILRRAEHGATIEELVGEAMSADPPLSRADADAYVDQLVERQALEANLAPSLTADDAHGELTARLAKFPEAEGLRRSLDQAREATGRIDWEPFSGDASRYQELAKLLKTSSKGPPLFRVRLLRSATEASLPGAIAREILRGAELLASIEEREDPLLAFSEAFLAKYGEAAVPLAEALDEETGIPFGGSVRGEDERKLAAPQSGTADLSAKEQLLLGKIEESWTTGSQVASLSWEEIASIRARDAQPLPDSFSVRGALCASSEAALDSGDYQFRLDGVSGPPVWAELAPMASSEPQLRERLARYLREEESLAPGAVFAEIVHFPEVGDPNLVVRPRLRAKEIPYLGRSAAEPADQISIADLRLSVAAGRLRLSSPRLNCEVIPRLTAPHDFTHPANPAIYRFLCALQNQGSAAAHLRWSWGALDVAAALPRIVCGKLVLCPARWVLDAQALEQQDPSSASARFRALCRIRNRLQLPRFVQTVGARGSTFDLENVLSAEGLIQKIRTEQRVTIFEMFPAGESLCAIGPHGRFVHELSVAFLRGGSTPTSTVSPRPPGAELLFKR